MHEHQFKPESSSTTKIFEYLLLKNGHYLIHDDVTSLYTPKMIVQDFNQ